MGYNQLHTQQTSYSTHLVMWTGRAAPVICIHGYNLPQILKWCAPALEDSCRVLPDCRYRSTNGKLKEMMPQLWVSMILDMFLGVPLFIYYGITEVKLLCMICGLSRWGIKRPNSEWMHNSRLWDAFFMYKTWQSNHRVKFIGSKKSGKKFFTWDPTDPVY